MSFTFAPAERKSLGLVIGLAGGPGSGKTFSAMELAAGICGSAPFAMVDADRGRSLHYADQFKFDYGEVVAPFRPQAFLDAVLAAEAAGYRAVVIDNFSAEHEGEGGLLDWAEEQLSELVEKKRLFAISKGWQFNEDQTRNANTMQSWIEPKMEHKKMMRRIMQLKAHVILCFRAEDKIEMVKVEGKTVVRPKETDIGHGGWVPICEKRVPYDLTASFLLMANNPGVGIPIKLEGQHRAFFPAGKPFTRATGEAIERWAKGEAPPAPPTLTSVLTAIKIAETLEQLDAVRGHAAKLAAGDKAKATEAYKARKQGLTPP